jgi:quercetin dioxygenase-like cupin family protein
MIRRQISNVKKEISSLDGAKGCTVQWLISKEEGARRYAMRLFTLQPDGFIPLHTHDDTEHEIFIIDGQGLFDDGKETIPVKEGDALFVPAGEKHSFSNQTQRPFKFICVIPI